MPAVAFGEGGTLRRPDAKLHEDRPESNPSVAQHTAVSGTPADNEAVARAIGEILWVRVTCDGDCITVKEAATQSGLDSASDCFKSTAFPMDGGFIGFGGGGEVYADDLTIEYWDGSGWKPAFADDFEVNGSSRAESKPTHDAAGNLTFDGLLKFTYDAWNRLAKVEHAWDNGALQVGPVVGTMRYDALGRRVTKTVGDDCATTHEMGDWEAVYRYYYDGDRVVEERNGSERVLRQYVWGTQYVDELIQVAVNQDPEDTSEPNGGACEYERYLWVLHDANYNVTGLVNRQGWLVERYEHTPYGQRTVYSRNWSVGDANFDGVVNQYDANLWAQVYDNPPADPNSIVDFDGDGDVDLADLSVLQGMMTGQIPPDLDGMVQNPVLESARGKGLGGLTPLVTGLCDYGHQGLFFDKEFGCYENRARTYHPTLARFLQRDRRGYRDGASLYQYVRGNPVTHYDPVGMEDLYVRGDSAYWVVEEEGVLYDRDVAEIYVGRVEGGNIRLGPGLEVSVDDARRIARAHVCMGSLGDQVRRSRAFQALLLGLEPMWTRGQSMSSKVRRALRPALAQRAVDLGAVTVDFVTFDVINGQIDRANRAINLAERAGNGWVPSVPGMRALPMNVRPGYDSTVAPRESIRRIPRLITLTERADGLICELDPEVRARGNRYYRLGLTAAFAAAGLYAASDSGEPPQLRRGKRAHAEEPVRPGEKSEYRTPSGKRIDRYNPETGLIREIKPNNPRAIRQGEKQVEGYREEMEDETGRPHPTEVSPYDPADYE